jgi:hypothetical protein
MNRTNADSHDRPKGKRGDKWQFRKLVRNLASTDPLGWRHVEEEASTDEDDLVDQWDRLDQGDSSWDDGGLIEIARQEVDAERKERNDAVDEEWNDAVDDFWIEPKSDEECLGAKLGYFNLVEMQRVIARKREADAADDRAGITYRAGMKDFGLETDVGRMMREAEEEAEEEAKKEAMAQRQRAENSERAFDYYDEEWDE